MMMLMMMMMMMMTLCLVLCGAGRISVKVKVEADCDDITEHPHVDKPRPYMCTVCEKQFRTKQSLSRHQQLHAGDQMYLCSQCQKQFASQHYLRIHMNGHSSKYKCTECGSNMFSNS